MPERNILMKDAELLEYLSPLVSKVVGRYVSRQVVPRREAEDTEQGILEKFIRRKHQILTSFEGKSRFSTYCIAVMNRMCCELIRSESRHWYAVSEQELSQPEASSREWEAEKMALVHQEVNRLSEALLFFNGQQPKVSLFLRYYFDLPVDDAALRKYCPQHFAEIKRMLQPAEKTNKGEKLEQLTRIVRLVEKRYVKRDAVRMWLNKQTDTLIKRLNTAGESRHNTESLAILMELAEHRTKNN